MTDATFLLNVKTSSLSTFNYRKMRIICAILLTALVFYTVLIEDSELIISKLSLRCMLFVFAIFSIELWLRGMGLMGSVAYIAAMLIIICTNDNEPNNAAYGLVEIRISLRFDKKCFASYHFRFVIFSLV